MKTNISIETTDEERLLIGKSLDLSHMVTRKELREEIERHVKSLIRRETLVRVADPEIEDAPGQESPPERGRSVCGFVPSRGDEPYLYKSQDPELAAACSSILDGLEFIEKHAWATLERNRQ